MDGTAAWLVFAALVVLAVVLALYRVRTHEPVGEGKYALVDWDEDEEHLVTRAPLSQLQVQMAQWGRLIFRGPLPFLVMPLVIAVACLSGATRFHVEHSIDKVGEPHEGEAVLDHAAYERMFGPAPRAQNVLLHCHPSHPVISVDMLKAMEQLEHDIRGIVVEDQGQRVSYDDVCYRAFPTRDCVVDSVLQYFRNPLQVPISALKNDSQAIGIVDHCVRHNRHPKCVCNETGVSVDGRTVLGGDHVGPRANTSSTFFSFYLSSTLASPSHAKEWERAFLAFMEHFAEGVEAGRVVFGAPGCTLRVAYSAQRSAEDELLGVVSGAPWAALACYGATTGLFSLFSGSLLLGVWVGVLNVAAAVGGVGLLSAFGVGMNAFVVESLALWMAVLAMDVPLTLALQYRSRMEDGSARIEMTLATEGPYLLAVALCQSLATTLGTAAFAPGVIVLSLTLCVSTIIALALHFTSFVAALILVHRPRADKYTPRVLGFTMCQAVNAAACCAGLGRVVYRRAAKVLFVTPVRVFLPTALLAMAFALSLELSLSGKVGLAANTLVPTYSYLQSFIAVRNQASVVGPVLGFTIQGMDTSDPTVQNLVCKRHPGCHPNSLANYLHFTHSQNKTQAAQAWYLAMTPSNWIDDYLTFLDPATSCCYVKDRTQHTPDICYGTNISGCETCVSSEEWASNSKRAPPEQFLRFLAAFLDTPNCDRNCTACGTTYGLDVMTKRDRYNNVQSIVNSRVRTHHSPLRTANDFVQAADAGYAMAVHIENIFLDFYRFRFDGGNAACTAHSELYRFNLHNEYIVDNFKRNVALVCVLSCVLCAMLLPNVVLVFQMAVVCTIVFLQFLGYLSLSTDQFNDLSCLLCFVVVGMSVSTMTPLAVATYTTLGPRKRRALHALIREGPVVVACVAVKVVGVAAMSLLQRDVYSGYLLNALLVGLSLSLLFALAFFPIVLSFCVPQHHES